MADLSKDIRLAVDTGKVILGAKEVAKAISDRKAQLVVIAKAGKADTVHDLVHVCSVAEVRTLKFNGGSMDLGAVCGKPHSVNSLAIIEPGNSKILEEAYS